MTLAKPWAAAKHAFKRDRSATALILTQSEAWDFYDQQAQKHLGISAEEFERRWKKGEYRARQEEPSVRNVVMVRIRKP